MGVLAPKLPVSGEQVCGGIVRSRHRSGRRTRMRRGRRGMPQDQLAAKNPSGLQLIADQSDMARTPRQKRAGSAPDHPISYATPRAAAQPGAHGQNHGRASKGLPVRLMTSHGRPRDFSSHPSQRADAGDDVAAGLAWIGDTADPGLDARRDWARYLDQQRRGPRWRWRSIDDSVRKSGARHSECHASRASKS